MKRAMKMMLCAFICFAVLFSSVLPVLAAGIEVGTSVRFVAEEEFAFKSQTEDFVLAVGGRQELRVEVGGVAPFRYVWEVSTNGGQSWRRIGIDAAYIITNAVPNTPANVPYQYSVTVTNSDNESISTVIKVLVSNDYEYKEATDDDSPANTPPTVSGYLHDSTVLHVDPIQPGSDLAPDVWTVMSAEIGTGETYIEPYNIYFTNSAGETVMYHGELTIKFNVGTEYNGMTVKIVHYHTPPGRVETLTGTVVNGVVSVKVHDLCPFMVVVPENTTHIIAAGADAGGSISPAGDVSVEHGGGMYFYFIPDSGYTVDKVYIDDTETAVTGNSYHFSNVIGDRTIRVTFKRIYTPPPVTYYAVTASSGAHGSISPSGSVQVAEGGSQTFYFIPDPGYELGRVTVDGVRVTVAGSSYRFSDIAGDHTIRVTFKLIDVPSDPIVYHTVTASVGANGRISPVGSVQVAAGESVWFYFIPDEGYELDTVVIDGEKTGVQGDSYCFVAVDADHTINVSFKKIEAAQKPDEYHTVTVIIGGKGSVSPSGDIRVIHGGAQTFYFIADEGYEIETICLNGEKLEAAAGQYTIENIIGDMELSVIFKSIETEHVSAELDCGCLWDKLFGSCAVCGWFGRCIDPWCALAPIIILLVVVGVIWYVLYRRK